MNTLLTQIESCINSRPLTTMSNDPCDLQVLTPAHFLIGDSLKGVPEPNLELISDNRLDIYQKMQKRLQIFWKRWVHEYISNLQVRAKWFAKETNVKPGMLVLIEDKTLPPLKWKLGRVHEVYPGKDGLIRVVLVKTAHGMIKRSIQHLAPLPWEQAPQGGPVC